MSLSRSRVAVLAAVLTPALGLAATVAPSALGASAAHEKTPAAARVAAAAPTTTLTLKVTGCEGCEIGLTSWIKGTPFSSAYGVTPRKVVDGTVVFTVPTSRTRGLVMSLQAPFAGHLQAQPLVALHYSGIGVGSPVSATQAAAGKAAHVCFAGTAESALTVAVKVGRTTGSSPQGEKVVAPRAFAAVSQPFIGTSQRTSNGVVYAQETVAC